MNWILSFVLGTFFISTDLFFPGLLLNFIPDCIGFFFFAYGLKGLEKKTNAINYDMAHVLGIVLTILTTSDLFNMAGFMSNDEAPNPCFVTVPDIFNYENYITKVDRFNLLYFVLIFLKLFILIFMCMFFFQLFKAFSQTNKKNDTPWFNAILCADYVIFILFQLALITNFAFPGIKLVIILCYIFAFIFFVLSIFIFFVVKDFIKKRKYA
ncbi:MAG: hypothetical protein IKZ25_02310 [Clostridia bacterium]|nr:hypothetical protein [Clostridia bacterium]